LIRQAQLAVQARLEDELRPFRLTATQYTVLSILGRRDGLSSAQLSRRFLVTPQSMNEVIATLEGKRLIRRQAALGNRRIRIVRLTAAGRKLLDASEEAVDRLEAGLFRVLKPAERTAFRQALQKLIAARRGVVRETADRGTTAEAVELPAQ
jgi:DNA-binding MarR family transcriptional regulator